MSQNLKPIEIARDWLKREREGVNGPAAKWPDDVRDRYHRDLGLLACFVEECWPKSDVPQRPVTDGPEVAQYKAPLVTRKPSGLVTGTIPATPCRLCAHCLRLRLPNDNNASGSVGMCSLLPDRRRVMLDLEADCGQFLNVAAEEMRGK